VLRCGFWPVLAVRGGRSRRGAPKDGGLLPAAEWAGFRLASEMTLTPIDADTIFSTARDGGIASCNGGGDFFLVGSRFALTGGLPGNNAT
jgi:hypothetical protein